MAWLLPPMISPPGLAGPPGQTGPAGPAGTPGDIYPLNGYCEPEDDPYPDALVWYEDATKAVKVLELLATYDGSNRVTTLVTNVYVSGTLSQTTTETRTYTGTSRVPTTVTRVTA